MSIRFGIVGTGKVAHRFARAVALVPEAKLVAVASRTKEKADAFASEFGIPESFGSYEEMAASNCIDAAYIAVPHSLHAQCSCLMMQNGKHVLCEKPLAVNAAEMEKMFACAKENKRLLMENMWARFVPGTLKLFDLMNSGTIGKLKSLEARFCYDMSLDDLNHHVLKQENGGGALLDIGIYELNFMTWFCGTDIEKLEAFCRPYNGTDAQTDILVQHADGILSHLSCATMLQKPRSGELYGTTGHIQIEHFCAPESIHIYHNDGTEEHIDTPYDGNGFEHELRHFCACISEGVLDSPVHGEKETLYIGKLMDTIRKKTGIVYPQDKQN